jgi:hypothetical protein
MATGANAGKVDLNKVQVSWSEKTVESISLPTPHRDNGHFG